MTASMTKQLCIFIGMTSECSAAISSTQTTKNLIFTDMTGHVVQRIYRMSSHTIYAVSVQALKDCVCCMIDMLNMSTEYNQTWIDISAYHCICECMWDRIAASTMTWFGAIMTWDSSMRQIIAREFLSTIIDRYVTMVAASFWDILVQSISYEQSYFASAMAMIFWYVCCMIIFTCFWG